MALSYHGYLPPSSSSSLSNETVPTPISTLTSFASQQYFHLPSDISSNEYSTLDGFNNGQTFNESAYGSSSPSSVILNETDEYTLIYDHPEEMLIPWVANPFFFPIVITNILTFIFGVSGNSLVIWFMLGDKANRSVTSIFLVSLAISDLLLLTIVAPLEIANYFVIQWDSDGTICRLATYAESVSAFASVLNLVAVTFERFVVIVFPIRSRSICTMENCKHFVIIVWILSIILAIPTIFLKETEKSTISNHITTITIYRCNPIRDWTGLCLSIYRFITLFALPSVFMIASYAWVIVELWISTRTMDDLTNHIRVPHRTESRISISRDACSSPSNHAIILRSHHAAQETRDIKSARKQVIKMLILVVLLFLVCWGPRLMGEIVFNCCLDSFTQSVYIIRIIIFLLPFIHSCLNPIVYCLMSSKFRKKIVTSLRRYLRHDRVSHVDLSSRAETSGNGHMTSIYTLHTSFDNGTRY